MFFVGVALSTAGVMKEKLLPTKCAARNSKTARLKKIFQFRVLFLDFF